VEEQGLNAKEGEEVQEGEVQQALQQQGGRHSCAAQKALDDDAAAVPLQEPAAAADRGNTCKEWLHAIVSSDAVCKTACSSSAISDITSSVAAPPDSASLRPGSRL
jgi:hypothetical protein